MPVSNALAYVCHNCIYFVQWTGQVLGVHKNIMHGMEELYAYAGGRDQPFRACSQNRLEEIKIYPVSGYDSAYFKPAPRDVS